MLEPEEDLHIVEETGLIFAVSHCTGRIPVRLSLHCNWVNAEVAHKGVCYLGSSWGVSSSTGCTAGCASKADLVRLHAWKDSHNPYLAPQP